MNIIKSSLKYPQVTLTVLFLVFAVGVYSLFTMPRREDPKITIRQGLVIAYYPGANSAQVEDQVTKKIEQYLFSYAEVRKEKTYSTTIDGEVVIHVELAESLKNPDVFWSKLRIDLNQNKVQDLPKGIIGPVVSTDFGDTIAMLIALQADSLDNNQLKEYLQQIDDGLRTVKGVSKIRHIGEQKDQITVSSGSERLSQYGIDLQQVVKILQSQNTITASGDIKTADKQVPLYTSGFYNTGIQLGNQIVGVSKTTGQVIKLNEVASIKRTPAEPSTNITVNGKKALMVSLEMQEGNNIVDFGKAVTDKLEVLQRQMPSSIKLTTIVNQPEIVHESVNDFIKEFFIAIVAVVIVIVLLLPLRIAAVAAMAIPVTVAVTFALLHVFGIELQQVSLAALIVVLGMVVDDAIVIADNYVELLDQKIDRKTAAWRSANDLVVPVLTATATIVCSFLPMVILTGSVGEFIFALPVTVTIALGSSFLVAMLLTPFLCYVFIRKGLHDHEAVPVEKKHKSLLDRMQNVYDQSINWCMKHRKFTLMASVASILLAGVLFTLLKNKFFPAAERNQFVIELWMPTGTKLDKTKEVINRAGAILGKDKRVVNYTTFTGTSAPRFYYNFAPEPPVTNYAQILVNTHDNEETATLAGELSKKIANLMPEGSPQVRQMQQGAPAVAPVEVRLTGLDLTELKNIGDTIRKIVSGAKGAVLVRSDFHEDYYGLNLDIKEEGRRLGFTTQSIATTIYTGFSGAAVTTIYEGNDPLNVVLQLDEKKRRNFDDLNNVYLTSPASGSRVPLRQLVNLKPEWETGRIMHRNGVRMLTVLAEAAPGALAADILKQVKPELSRLRLPPGYQISYGGEEENQKETFAQMIVALGISIVLIFLILLFQFRNLKEALVVMSAIPLSLLGAVTGLLLTNNPFGFTAFMGIISLSGIVVRNAIILIDHTNVLLKEGQELIPAALESGKRRLRPIFLTAMAAAVGVVPMIVSGSPLWSPLASVIAVGVIFSMVMALLVTPVLFVMVIKPADKKELLKAKDSD